MIYRERLSVPVAWWVLGALLALSALAAVGFYLGPGWGLGVAAACLALLAGLFWSAAVVITVTDQAVSVGRAVIEPRYLADCRPLDADQTVRRSGPEADARAHLVLRPYVPTAVELTLDDADDPVPYWLVSSRRPGQLAAAVRSVLGTRVTE